MDKINREYFRRGLVEFIATNKPKYALTVTFEANSFEIKTRKALDHLIVRMNKEIYKGRYINGLSDLKGVVSRERGKLLSRSTQGLMYCDHYHIIIFEGDGYLPEREHFRRKLLKEIDLINRDDESARFRTHMLQDYFNEGSDSLEMYVTKIFDDWFLDDEYVTDSIGVIGRDRVEFGRLFFEEK